MHLKLLRAAATVALLGGTVTLGLGSAPAALAATTDVACGASLSTAITDAASGDVLVLAPNCTYWLTSGLPMINKDLTIVGHDSTWIKRSYEDDTPSFSIFSVCSAGDLTLKNVNVANGGGSDQEDGGAVYINTGTLTVHGGTFTDNNVNDYGGAIDNAFGTLTVYGTTFTDNSAEWGGAIYSEEDASTIDGATFSKNDAYEGGAIFNNDTMTINHSTITLNRATAGGGIYNYDTLTINYSVITFNRAHFGDGGAIYNDEDPTNVTLTGNLINWNFPENCEPIYTIAGCSD